jgi:hypothetical protein
MADLKTIVDFLLGERSFMGCEFGEKPFNGRGKFWWRNHLREAWELHNNSAPVQAEQSLEVVAYRALIPQSRRGYANDYCFYMPESDMLKAHISAGDEVIPLTDHAQATAEIARLQGEVKRLRRCYEIEAQHGAAVEKHLIDKANELSTALAESGEMREALQGLVAWADDLRRDDPCEDLRKARAALARNQNKGEK